MTHRREKLTVWQGQGWEPGSRRIVGAAGLVRLPLLVWWGARGYTRRTARESRSTLATILADAAPRYIRSNPAARKRGKGRKGQRRIERAERAEKTWATPLEALLFAERCSGLSGADTDFVMLITIAYTGMRTSGARTTRAAESARPPTAAIPAGRASTREIRGPYSET